MNAIGWNFHLRLRTGLETYSSHIAVAMLSLRAAALVRSSRGTAAAYLLKTSFAFGSASTTSFWEISLGS